jgi:hypothetical protein
VPLVPTKLFGDYRIAAVTSGRSRFGHTFGGPPDRKGTSRADCNGILIHLLHRFDLSDPLIPIKIPGIRWLPLYYCFDFRVNVLGYRLTSDESLLTFFPTDDENVSDDESWPDEDYPLEFPKSTVKLSAFDYDPTNLEDAYIWSGVFGIRKLSSEDQAAARKRVVEEMDGLGLGPVETEEDFEDALQWPFMQGKPNGDCMNPDCPNYRMTGKLAVFALMPAEPVKGIHTFGRWGGGVSLIFEICPDCFSIRVSNQCD